MKKPLLFFCFTLLLPLFISGQGMPVVVVNKDGKAKYKESPDARWTKIKSGDVLESDGQLKMCRKTSLKLFSDGVYQEVSDTKRANLSELFPEERVTMGVLGFVSNSIGDNTTEGTSSGATSDGPKPPRDGFGDADFYILPLKPFARKVPLGPVDFAWNVKMAEPGYLFKIVGDGGKVLLEKEVMDNHLQVDLAGLKLAAGDQFQWKVSVKGDMAKKSPDVTIEIEGADALEGLLAPLRKEKVYMDSEPCVQLTLEAALLQDKKFYYSAMERLEKAMKTCPDNQFVKKMYEGHKAYFGLDF